jgi:hypothetical protein
MQAQDECLLLASCKLFKYFPFLLAFDLLPPLSVEIEINANLMVVRLWGEEKSESQERKTTQEVFGRKEKDRK